jgi:hypothetical protein
MPCCTPHHAAQPVSLHQTDCCNTRNCERPPATADEYTAGKQIHERGVDVALTAVAIVSTTLSIPQRPLARQRRAALPPPAMQRRIALLSTILV